MITQRRHRLDGKVLASCAVLALVVQLSADSASTGADASKFEKKFVEVVEGKIYRGIQPGDEEDYQFLRSRGIKTHLNLRKYLKWQERDMHEKAETFGFVYRHTGMPTLWMEPKDPEVGDALAHLNDVSLQPIYIHCRLGKDRTGLIIALYRVIYQKWDACTAWQEWSSFGYKAWNSGLKDYYERRLRKETGIASFDPAFEVGNCRR